MYRGFRVWHPLTAIRHFVTTALIAQANFSLFTSLFSLLFLLSCGPDRGTFRMEGDFKSFNQGEFYVYSPDGGIRKLDTIGVKGGHFIYQVPLDSTATFVLVFPNYSEIPVFGASGTTAEIQGDASHLKEVVVKGIKDNEQMTDFRLKVSEMTPPETVKAASDFIKAHPESPASIYLLNKYFIQSPSADYREGYLLVRAIREAQPGNRRVEALVPYLQGLASLHDGGTLPKFTATDIKGRPVSSGDLYAPVNVITTWSSWNYDSQNIQRHLKYLEKRKGTNQLRIVSICLDASVQACQKTMDRDSITWPTICDGRMWETPVLAKLGLSKVPDNIITDSQGKIIAHSLPMNALREKIEELLR